MIVADVDDLHLSKEFFDSLAQSRSDFLHKSVRKNPGR